MPTLGLVEAKTRKKRRSYMKYDALWVLNNKGFPFEIIDGL
jgi:hypothetical protein